MSGALPIETIAAGSDSKDSGAPTPTAYHPPSSGGSDHPHLWNDGGLHQLPPLHHSEVDDATVPGLSDIITKLPFKRDAAPSGVSAILPGLAHCGERLVELVLHGPTSFDPFGSLPSFLEPPPAFSSLQSLPAHLINFYPKLPGPLDLLPAFSMNTVVTAIAIAEIATLVCRVICPWLFVASEKPSTKQNISVLSLWRAAGSCWNNLPQSN